MKPSYNKYSNKKVLIDGITFHSKKEGKRYSELKVLLMTGEISDLKLQPSFPFVVNGQKICSYKADFSYTYKNHVVVEDVKGFLTDVYKIKKKLFLALYPDLVFRET